MRLYEATFIARQDISSNEIERIIERLVGIVTDNGGQLVKKESWGLRNLAYPIKKNRKGHYIMLGIEANSDAIDEMLRVMSINEDILRQLIVKVESISEEPSAIINIKKNAVVSNNETEKEDSEEAK